jgi:hypothetical protein
MVNKSVLIMVASIVLAAGLTTAAKAQGAECEVVCKPGDVYLPDPASCNHFYQCSNGVPYRQPCPGDLVFNPNVRPGPVCDWPSDYHCAISCPPTH